MIQSLNHITLAVKDIDKSFEFYRDILKLKPLCKWKYGAYFLVGDFWFCLNVDGNARMRKDLTHFAFTVAQDDFLQVAKEIQNAGCEVWKNNTSEGDSLYFRDLDGHKLEIHVGDWMTRIGSMKSTMGENLEIFCNI